MQLIKNLPPRIINSRMVSFGLFYCEHCKQEVIRRLGDGKRNKSCGCMKQKFLIKHGESHTKLHKVWSSMKKRCLNLNDKGYKDYGGRGITVCNEWLEFIPFRDWAINNGYTEGLEINRMNNNNNYEPSNCNFVTHEENAQNKRNNKIKSIKIANEIRDLDKTGLYTRKELAIKYNVSIVMISNIINNKSWKNT